MMLIWNFYHFCSNRWNYLQTCYYNHVANLDEGNLHYQQLVKHICGQINVDFFDHQLQVKAGMGWYDGRRNQGPTKVDRRKWNFSQGQLILMYLQRIFYACQVITVWSCTLGENLKTESATSRLNRRSLVVSSKTVSDGIYSIYTVNILQQATKGGATWKISGRASSDEYLTRYVTGSAKTVLNGTQYRFNNFTTTR